MEAAARKEHMAVDAVRAYYACRRMYVRMCAICLVTCLLLFGCCAYCTWALLRAQNLLMLCQRGTLEVSSHENRLQPSSFDENPLKQDRVDDNKPVVVEYESDRIHRVKRQASSKKKASLKKRKKGHKKRKPHAGHYESFADATYIQKKLPGYDGITVTRDCMEIAEMKGTLCRNQDFTTSNPNGTLHVFKPAPWVNQKLAPFKMDDNGIFSAKSTGVYLVYAQVYLAVLFDDNKRAQIVELVHKQGHETKQALTCWVNADENQPKAYNSCGITGLFYLKKKDTLRLQNYYNDVKLNLRKTTTYLGAVLLK